jgi:hypothetical protein
MFNYYFVDVFCLTFQLMLHLEKLTADPTMRIHYGFSGKQESSPSSSSSLLSMSMFRWLGLEGRVVSGDMTADRVLLPREGGCQDPMYNTWELLQMRKTLVERAWSHHCAECDAILNKIVGRPINRTGKGYLRG